MARQIYKLFLGKPAEAWHQMPKQEQDSLFAKTNQALEKVGGKSALVCDSRWASEQWLFFGLEVSDIEVVRKFTEMLNELNWFRYMESMTVLGTEMPASNLSIGMSIGM